MKLGLKNIGCLHRKADHMQIYWFPFNKKGLTSSMEAPEIQSMTNGCLIWLDTS